MLHCKCWERFAPAEDIFTLHTEKRAHAAHGGTGMRPSFADFKRPPLVDMIIVETPTQFITNVHNAIYDGADAFGFQMERLKPEFRTEEMLTKMFSHLGDRPLYITNYRGAYNHEMTEEARLDELKLALRCGASLLDITGDTFDPTPGELTKNPTAIDKQKKFIEEVHEMGGQVLMSSHIYKFLPEEEVLAVALEQQSRGADVVKFVTWSDSEEELMQNLAAIRTLKRELKVPFLFLSGGRYCRMHRAIGPYLGVCCWLCVERYDTFSSREQPLLRAMHTVVENLDLTAPRPTDF